MPFDRLQSVLEGELAELGSRGTLKGEEAVITGIVPAEGDLGPRVLLSGEGKRPFLRMNSNSYLGMSLRPELVQAEEEAVRRFGTGPGAVRFISGSYEPHVALESRLADFHRRESAMIFSSAYATTMGVLPSLIDSETAVVSDELNHNCIINAMRLARPKQKLIYNHLDMVDLEERLRQASRDCSRALIVTDGIFSMRGDHAPLQQIMELARKYDGEFTQNVVVVADDSHGVGAFGATGRGTEE
ncbi:MAG: aminotransferase class I/II-fold pyridoxal phosphate-dependent enzyme, partial [Acidobacteriota bacterium]